MESVPWSKQKTILVVDDNRNNLDLLSEILASKKYSVRRAINGQIALEFVQHLKPDLVLLDINMPGLTGYEVCQQIKSCPETQHVPIIFISALGESLDKAKAFKVGGVDYITKPFEVLEVLARVENQLSLHAAKAELRSALDRQLQQRADELEAEAERSLAITQVVDKVRQTLDLETVFETATTEIRNLLKVDRAVVIQLNGNSVDSGGQIVAESKICHLPTTLGYGLKIQLQQEYSQAELEGKARVTEDCVEDREISDELSFNIDYRESKYYLNRFRSKNCLIVPIVKDRELWGLFSIYCSSPEKRWLSADIDFIQKVCAQLGVALQQTQLLQNARNRAVELASTLADMSAIVDNLVDGLLVTDINGVVTRLNPALLKMLGLKSPVQLLHHDLADHLPEELVSLVQEVALRERSTAELEMNFKDGHQGKAIVSPILKISQKLDKEICQGCVILIRDITREKEIDRVKTDFLSTVSHELRTPLTSVLGFTSIIESKLKSRIEPAVPKENEKAQKALRLTKKNLSIVVSEAERLTSLINDVLDISKMEEGKVAWNFQLLDPVLAFRQAIAATTVLFKGKDIELIQDFPDSLPLCYVDRDRIIQVLINLISNAVKFTNKGFVRCSGSINNGKLLIRVSDSGIGLSTLEQEKIFEKFTQVGDLLTSKPQGSGLGLSICRQIVEAHSGRIWVESQVDKGSIFSILIPVKENLPGSSSEFSGNIIQELELTV